MSTSPAKPLSATFDRGPAKYFHGRQDVFEKFDELAEKSKALKGGSTFIIQGAPGVGKTALLYECEKRAEKDGWDVVDLKHPAPLWDAAALRDVLGVGKVRNVVMGIGNILANRYTGPDLTSNLPKATASVIGVLENHKKHLLLILDEAQLLLKEHKPPKEKEGIITSVVSAIHNGKLNTPVILLAAGLGGTREAFSQLGISRTSERCFVELEQLEKEPEHAVIRDYLVRDGGANGDLSAWIEAIASKTHGWPQHIVSYGYAAGKLLRTNQGDMTPELLDRVLERGASSRERYYQGRAEGMLEEHRVCLAKAVERTPRGVAVDHKLIKASFEKEFGPTKAKDLFNLVHRKGILDERNGKYFIPIPSMYTWLVETYAKDREQTIHTGNRQVDTPKKPTPLNALYGASGNHEAEKS